MKKKEGEKDSYDPAYLKAFRKLSGEEKLNFLEEMNHFLLEAMPIEKKKIWDELRKKGF